MFFCFLAGLLYAIINLQMAWCIGDEFHQQIAKDKTVKAEWTVYSIYIIIQV